VRNTHTHTHTHAITLTRTHTYMHVQFMPVDLAGVLPSCTHICTHTYSHTHSHTLTLIHTHNHTYSHTYVYARAIHACRSGRCATFVHAHMHSHTHTHTHTHTRTYCQDIIIILAFAYGPTMFIMNHSACSFLSHFLMLQMCAAMQATVNMHRSRKVPFEQKSPLEVCVYIWLCV